MRQPLSRPVVLVTAVAMALLAAGCTGTPASQSTADANAPVTIKFWHGWSQPHEVAAIQANIDAFEKLHPNITVVSTPNVTDDKLLQGIRSGSGPDVVSSFTTDNVGLFCNGALDGPEPAPAEGWDRQEQGLRQDDDRLHPVQGEAVHAAPAGRRHGPVLQQGHVRRRGDHLAAEDLVGVHRRCGQADQAQGRQLLAAGLHAELPRVQHHAGALPGPVRRHATSPPTARPTSPTTRR